VTEDVVQIGRSVDFLFVSLNPGLAGLADLLTPGSLESVRVDLLPVHFEWM